MISQNYMRLLRMPVGNNLKNDPEDVLDTKQKFRSIGYYDRTVENGYMDQELRDAVTQFQSDNALKKDGKMLPGGETEATLVGHLMRLPKQDKNLNSSKNPPTSDDRGYQKAAVPAAAVPTAIQALMGILGAYGIGTSLQETWEKWQNMDTSDREEAVFKAQCDRMYESETRVCNNTTQTKGEQAGAICHQSAAARYAACLAGKPEAQWPDLQD